MRWRLAGGVLLLLAQLAWPGPRFLWAPFHEHAVYALDVDVDGRKLTTREALARYRLPAWHFSEARGENWETNDLRSVVDAIQSTEAKTTGPVRVELRARVNGEGQPPWRWARPR